MQGPSGFGGHAPVCDGPRHDLHVCVRREHAPHHAVGSTGPPRVHAPISGRRWKNKRRSRSPGAVRNTVRGSTRESDEVGSDLWSVTHIDDQARADAPAQWASFAAEAGPGQVTVGTIIRAAKDAGFVFAVLRWDAAASGHVSHGPFTMDADDGLTKQVMTGRGRNSARRVGEGRRRPSAPHGLRRAPDYAGQDRQGRRAPA